MVDANEDYQLHKLLEIYKDPDTDKVMGLSKWYFTNGEFEWRECEILSLNEKEERFEI